MEVMLLGTGGWVPTDSRETACVYLREGKRLLLLDAGTGARRLITSPELMRGIARVDICLSHFHLDHIIGLTYLPGLPAEIERVVWGPGRALYATHTIDLLRRAIAPPLFALDISQIVSAVEELAIGELEIGPFQIAIRAQQHHSQPSAAFRVGDDLAYCTDTGYDEQNARFAAGCRDLVHEAFYLEHAPDDTHSTPSDAARIARDAGVSRLTLVHLDPRLDQETRLLEEAAAIFPQAQVGRDLTVLS